LIPRAQITEWASRAPWSTEADIEQDLILSRLMVAIAKHDLLGCELAMRGGTCLYKLHLRAPLRYSEDLDYVRRTNSAVGPYIDALRDIGVGAGLAVQHVDRPGKMVHVIFDTESTDGLRRIRIKIETNIKEIEACFERTTRPYRVDSRWWSGEADIPTFELDELMGTKLRALHQRSKGRDLFDLWHALTETALNDERVIQALNHYMGAGVFRYNEFAVSLAGKLDDPGFANDLDDFVTKAPAGYELAAAANLVMERLGSRLTKAPGVDEIRDGRWREAISADSS